MASNQKLIFQDSEAVKNAIMDSQKKEIAKLYENWADEIGKKAEYYSKKTTPSSVVTERQMKELQKQLKVTSHEISNEINSMIKKNMYTVADAVVADNAKWLEDFGFSAKGINAAFSYVPDSIVRNIVTGQIYKGGWNLSSKIWGDNEATMKSIYQIVAKGVAENSPIYDIAKEIEQYVSPSKQKGWNPVLAMKNTKTGKIEYKRIYKKQIDYNAQRLARTLVQHSYQQSFIAVTKDNPFIEDYIWHSNGSRVCPLCLARDGKHFKKNELPMDHPNGMCTMEPVVTEDMVDKLAEWFNSPDGTFPEIDKFAGNFGYDAKVVGTPIDFVNKYGMSTKSPNAWFNGLTQIQKAEAKALKDKSGMTWNQWYETYIQSTGDPTKDFIKKYGTSNKSPNAWYNGISAGQKAEAKALKEKSGLNWTQWYEQNVFAGGKTTSNVAKGVTEVIENKVENKVKVKAFNEAQEKYFKPYGYSVDNMPKDFSEWSHTISHKDATEILNEMGTDWGDPHPYQKIMQYYEQNLTSSKFIDVDADDVVKAASKTAAKKKVTTPKPVHKPTPKPAPKSKIDNKFNSTEWYNSLNKNKISKFESWTKDWLKTLTPDERSAVTTYTGSAYSDMNKFLRGQRSTTSYMNEIEACRKALEKASLPEETIVRRGAGTSVLKNLGIGDINPDNKGNFIGAIIHDKGFMSTSPDPSGGFDMSVEYVIKLPKGSQAMYVAPISKFKSEKELLINCGGKFIIEDMEFNSYGDVKKVYMTLINLQN